MTAPLFFIPGWCLGRGPLEPLLTALDGKFIDLPGYGDAQASDDWPATVDRIAQSLPEHCQLGGWSLGALLALAVAARAPEKISRLVLIAGTASFVQRPEWPWAMPAAALAEFTQAIAHDPESMLPRFVGGFNRGDTDARRVTRHLLDVADARPRTAVLLDGLTWLATVDLRPALAGLRTPTLLIQGEHDPLMPAGAGHWLQSQLVEAQLRLIPGTAHAPFVSAEADVIQACQDFLGR